MKFQIHISTRDNVVDEAYEMEGTDHYTYPWEVDIPRLISRLKYVEEQTKKIKTKYEAGLQNDTLTYYERKASKNITKK